ncbi:MAG TPA: UTP--glucose-1-phosphate uridylyltransferase GalU [Gammaproteobacteria bacterium]|nr:UTP--glucose-1-phosphate uridylyltransferase GalU [Gammaproteobacteria bacterium]
MDRTIRKAVFPVAGLGTRFLPATKAMAKEMLPVVDKPLIQYAVEEAVAAGIDQVIFVTGRGKRSIEDHFDHQDGLENQLLAKGKDDLAQVYREVSDMAEVIYVRQKQPLGLGHAVWCARHAVGDEPFAVLLPDDLMDDAAGAIGRMKAAYEASGASQVAVEPVAAEDVGSYGVIDPGEAGGETYPVRGLVEKPEPGAAPSSLAVIGRYVLSPTVFEPLGRARRGAGGEIQLTDALQALITEYGEAIQAYPFEGVRFDCGSKLGYLKAQVEFGLRRGEFGEELAAYLRDRLGSAGAGPVAHSASRR